MPAFSALAPSQRAAAEPLDSEEPKRQIFHADSMCRASVCRISHALVLTALSVSSRCAETKAPTPHPLHPHP